MSEGRIFSPNYTQIPNVVFDYWMHVLTHAEFKVLCAICRKTFGWRKAEDYISTKQIVDMTGVSKRSVHECIASLHKKGLIEIIRSKTKDGDDAPNFYRVLVEDAEIAVGSAASAPPHEEEKGVVQPVHQVVQPVYKGSAASAHTKETIQKKDREIERKPYGKHVKLSDEEYNLLCSKEPKEKVDQIIEEINDHCINNRPKGYDDYVAAFRTFLRNQNKTQGKSYGTRTKNKRKSNPGEDENPTGIFINGVRVE
jgi:phage replication O-like protein O